MNYYWHYPSTVTQFAEHESHVSWNDEATGFSSIKHLDSRYITTSKDLLHIATFDGHDIKMKTYYLYLTDFKIQNVPNEITGLEVEISVRRGGRITDDTIQLMHNGEFIGENLANFDLNPVKQYGGLAESWGTSLSRSVIEDSSFGVGIRFKSHPSWPHRESPKLDYVRLRVW